MRRNSMKKMNKENPVLLSLVEKLMKSQKPIWRKVAYELSRSRKQRVQVNLSKIDQYATEDTIVIVPGKVLGSGVLTKKITIAAFAFSESAKKLIGQVGGKVVSIENLHKTNPDGRGTVLLK